MNFLEFINEIDRLKKSNQFQIALEFFKQNKEQFTKEQIRSNQFLISNIIACLRKTNQSNFVNRFLGTYDIAINEQINSKILTQYGWAIYDILKIAVNNNNYNKANILNLLRTPIYLLSVNISDFTSSIISNIFGLLLRKEKDKQNEDYKFLDDFCNLFNPNILSTEVSTIEQKGKSVELASDKEKWYATKSKALFELGLYQECFDISEKALHEFNDFHYNNDLWFARRMALSKKSLGNINEAINDLEKIFRRKKEWFIQKELSALYFEANSLDRAYQYALEAMARNGFGKLEFKIGLIFLLGNILKTQSNTTMANKHFWAVKCIREQNGYKIPSELQQELNSFEPIAISCENLLNELKRFWQPPANVVNKSKQNNSKQARLGIIKKILNDNEKGKNGFITSDRIDFYFTSPSHTEFCKNIVEGCSVDFVETEQEDGRKKAKIIKVNQ